MAPPLSDKLRESQKAALIAYVLTLPGIRDAGVTDSNKLFEYFLIDVEMSACMKTSRVKQAISSAQLFVDRCLMNLEAGVLPDAIDIEVWQWMKYYRVWEANRKVFLYPENWIEAVLRDNKSPFFKELGSELLSHDVTMETAENAFMNYLEKLDQVARLEICGMYWDTRENEFPTLSLGAVGPAVVALQRKLNAVGASEQPLQITGVFNEATRDAVKAFQHSRRLSTNGVVGPETWAALESGKIVNILHAFGRTFHTPHVYFYRKLINNTTWTPWEKVQADIEGDHLFPVVWNRRLHIFWPLFTEKSVQPQSEGARITKYWEVKLAWSEYRNNKWSAKQISTDAITFKFIFLLESQLPEKDKFTFKALVGKEDSLKIQIYYASYNAIIEGDGIPILVGECDFESCQGRTSFKNISNRWLLSANDVSHILPYTNESALVFPTNLVPEYMWLRGKQVDREEGGPIRELYLLTGDFSNSQILHDDVASFVSSHSPLLILQNTPSIFRLLYPHQYPQFALGAPFFYQDVHRTYFVTPALAADVSEAVQGATPVLPETGIVDTGPILLRLPPAPLLSRGVPAVNGPERLPMAAAVEPVSIDDSAVMRSATSIRIAAGVDQRVLVAANWATQVENRYGRYWAQSVRPYLPNAGKTYHLKFAMHYHPYVCDFIKALNSKGIPGLMSVDMQLPKSADPEDDANTVFNRDYHPTKNVDHPYPHINVDFSTEGEGAYSLYNWEWRFHMIMLIATSLSQNQRFAEARHWFHYIFDPTASANEAAPQRYWPFVPFKKTEPERIDDLLAALNYKGNDPQKLEQKTQVQKQVQAYMYDPFQPHAIARLRPGAYMKNVVMKYIDNLIAWGDLLFRRDTIESINEATLLYVLAGNIMGPKPQRIPPRGKAKAETYASLKESKLDLFSNAIVSFENHFPFASSPSTDSAGPDASSGLLGLSRTLYFCTPQNDKLLGYWDTIADRLFKIRHCMNIEGVVRELPLFEPPIDPALLVRAAAAGLDLNSVLNDLYAPLPHYRFSVMVQKATELCAEVKALGAAFLSAWEKRDAEELATLRARQETSILELVSLVKQQQYNEAVEARNGLAKSRDVAVARYRHYQKLLGQDNAPVPQIGESIPEAPLPTNANLVDSNGMKLISYEKEHLDRTTAAVNYHITASVFEYISNILHMISDFHVEPFGVGASIGGSSFGLSMSAYARGLQNLSSKENMEGSKASTLGGFFRRQQDWVLQSNLAAKEIMQIDKQIAAADIRVAIAQQEIINHDKQIQNAKEIEDFLSSKFTSEELYTWMIDALSAIYFQSYKLAYDVAKKAERIYRFELGLTNSNFITFGYWDNLRKGLVAGEKLFLDLKRMEMAYLDQNKREYEITKNISLLLHDPLALITLKETGQCQVELPEALFDADYPGHYMRRIKSVSLTIPCVVGPYTSINCTLTLLSNKTRIKSSPAEPYPETQDEEDDRFVTNFAAIQSIATSHAQNDSGLFELNFRDERYLPFEGAGAISRWRIDLPIETNAFDFNTLSDAVLHLKYTAREGGELLKKAAAEALEQIRSDTAEPSLVRMFSARHEFPGEWHQFLHPQETDNAQTLDLQLLPERFPFQFRGRTIHIQQVESFLKFKDQYAALYGDGTLLASLSLTPAGGSVASSAVAAFKNDPRLNGLPHMTPKEPITAQGLGMLQLIATDDNIAAIDPALRIANRLKAEAIEDIIVICHYSVDKPTV